MSFVGRRLTHTAGRSGLPNNAQRRSGSNCTHGIPAGLPPGIPGIGEEIEGAMQQAPQPERQFIAQRRPLRLGRNRFLLGKREMPRGRDAREPFGSSRYYLGVTPTLNMKLSVPSLVTILALGLGAATFSTGCAGTATRESTGEYIDDATIGTKVKAAFVKDPLVKALDVKVETFKGAVQLSGFVDTAEQKARAQQIAAGVNGVVSVKNNITLKSSVAR